MIALINGLDVFIAAVRTAATFVVLVFGLLCVIDWAVRTRRINPFNPLARFFRSTVDPIIAPVERRVLRAGGTAASAPWWALAGAAVGAIVLVTVLGFLRDQLAGIAYAADMGPSGLFRLMIGWTVAFLRLAILVRVLSSWFGISPYSGWVRWSFAATEWILSPLRRVIPTLGPLDVTPIVAYFALGLVGSVLMNVV